MTEATNKQKLRENVTIKSKFKEEYKKEFKENKSKRFVLK